jgi:hypothetical protein
MHTAVNRPLKLTAFNANSIEKQDYEVRKQLQDLKIDMALFSETHLKLHMMFYIPNYDIYRTDHEDRYKGGTAVAVKKGNLHNCIDLSPILTVKTDTKAELPLQLRKTTFTIASTYLLSYQ